MRILEDDLGFTKTNQRKDPDIFTTQRPSPRHWSGIYSRSRLARRNPMSKLGSSFSRTWTAVVCATGRAYPLEHLSDYWHSLAAGVATANRSNGAGGHGYQRLGWNMRPSPAGPIVPVNSPCPGPCLPERSLLTFFLT